MGKHHGKLGYGYDVDGTIDVGQATIVREIAARILAGESLFSITSELNARRIPSPRGILMAKPKSSFNDHARFLVRLAGGEPGGRGHGHGELVAKGEWAAILDRETTEQLRALLTDPVRRRGRQPQHLLTGILVCGRCESRMSGGPDGAGGHRYACSAQPGLSRCGRCTVSGPPVDALVTEAVFAALTGSPMPASPAAAPPAESVAELEDARRRLATLAEEYAAGRISHGEWAAARAVVVNRLERAQAELQSAPRGAALGQVPRERNELERWWADAMLDRQRAVLKVLIERVVVRPAGKGGNRFDASRIEPPVWRV